MTAGPILAGTGLLALSRVGVSTNFTLMIPVLMMMGIGMGLTMTPMTAAVMNAVGAARAGLGSAMTNTSREAGGVFGIALLGTLLTTKLKSVIVGSLGVLGIPLSQRLAIAASAGHGTLEPSLLRGLTPQQATAVRAAFDQAFIKGLHIAFFIAALFVLASAIIANRFIPSGAPQSDEESSYERFRPPAGRASSNGRVERKARTRV
jgi:hypothetical protein